MRSRPSVYLLPLLVLSALTGCSGEEGTHLFETIELDGIPTAVNRGGPRFEGELFEYELILTLQEDERAESMVYNSFGFDMDEQGRFYVADSGDPRIAVYDAEGRYLRALGGKGQGPGEFLTLAAPEVHGEVISVVDGRQHRAVLYGTDGELVDTFKLPGGSILSNVRGFAPLEGGRYLFHRLDTPVWPDAGLDAAVNVTVVEADSDTVWSRTTEPVPVFQRVAVDFEGQEQEFQTSIPFGPFPNADFHPDHGLVASDGSGPEVHYLDPYTGVPVRKVRLELPPAYPETQETERVSRGLQDLIDERESLARAMLQAQQKAVEEASGPRAPWTNLHIDEGGYLWLRLPDFEDWVPGGGAVSYRIVSPEGEYLGITTVPPGSGFRKPAHGRLLVKQSDPETGGVSFRVYRIRPRADGFHYP